jgi:alpha-tubulin suppressor-like RCC1 family protein
MLNTGAVQCFGSNAAGQLGRGNAVTLDATPASVQGLSSGAVTISAGASHACAVTPAGEVMCWGLNDFGQLGDNSQDNSNLPVVVPFFSALATTPIATITTVTATTILEVIPPSPMTSTSQPATTEVATSSTKVVKISRNRSVTAAKIASAVSLKIPKRSQGSMRISITRGTRYCMFVGSAVRGVKKGTCTVTVVLLPKKGKPTVRTLKIQVL